MGESKQFRAGRVFGDKNSANVPGVRNDCAECESMLADALDGSLTRDEQLNFDLHLTSCEACRQIVGDARRGVAWLEMLRHPAPEPPAHLVDRILEQTSTVTLGETNAASATADPAYAAYSSGMLPGAPAHAAKLLPFPGRAVAAMRRNTFGQLLLQPRLAMTAAMAFFSIALTLNITGFHPTSLRASDLTPGSLRRDVVSANSNVVRYYESLRVVYELESRVHDLQSAQDSDAAGSTIQTPQQVPTAEPSNQPDEHKAQPPARRQPAPGAGSSQREDIGRPQRLAVSQLRKGHRTTPSRTEWRQA